MTTRKITHISDDPKLLFEVSGKCAIIHQADPLRGDEGIANRVYLEPWEARELIELLQDFAA